LSGGDANPVLYVLVAIMMFAAFLSFGLRAVRIVRGRPRDAGEFVRRWFGKGDV
jgi:hypothetical protein